MTNAPDRPAPPMGTEEEPPRPSRPWLGVAIASAVALLLLVVILIPGVLRFPEEPEPPNDDELLALQQAENEGLRDRIEELRRTLEGGVCYADGGLFRPDENGYAGEAVPDPRGPAALPPDQTPIPPEILQDGAVTPPETNSILALMDRSTALIVAVEEATGSASTGTGFFVAPDKILTNLHVIGLPPASAIYVFNQELGEARQASVLARSENIAIGDPDFALLQIPGARIPPYTIAGSPGRLDEVIAAGFPSIILESDPAFQRLLQGDASASPSLAVTEGVVTALQNPQGSELVLHSATVSSGNSGGPLVDYCGRVVGINTFINSDDSFRRVNYALSAGEVRRFLAANGVEPSVSDDACTPATSRPPAVETEIDEGIEASGDDPAPGDEAPVTE